ncbi:MAG: hypothetical protein GY788_16950 [bacterium]|nr:hypothetical protein [bacterium]
MEDHPKVLATDLPVVFEVSTPSPIAHRLVKDTMADEVKNVVVVASQLLL